MVIFYHISENAKKNATFRKQFFKHLHFSLHPVAQSCWCWLCKKKSLVFSLSEVSDPARGNFSFSRIIYFGYKVIVTRTNVTEGRHASRKITLGNFTTLLVVSYRINIWYGNTDVL